MEAIIALSTSGFIEKYGAYAGLAAIPGLAVLSLLYFAQAREVRRLRDWAGRAPERDSEQRSTSGVHVAPTGARDPVSVVRRSPPPGAARPAGKPATPAASTASPPSPAAPAKPAGGAAAPAAATAAAAAGAMAAAAGAVKGPDKQDQSEQNAKPDQEGPAAKPAHAPAPVPAAAPETNGPGDPSNVEKPVQRPAAAPAPAAPPAQAAPRPAAPAAATAAGAAAARASAGPAAPPRPEPREHPAAPQPTAAPARPSTPGASASRAVPLRTDRPRAAAPSRGGRDPVPPRGDTSGGRPRRAAYIAVAAVLVIILIVVIVAATSGGSSSKPKSPNTIAPSQQQANGAGTKPKKAAPVPRGDVKVAVLNGTTQAGLAAEVGNQVAAGGFAKGQVANAADQQAQQTIVYYASGQKKAAQEVASIIKVGDVQPIDPDTRAIAGNDAKVVVLVGADKT